MTFAIQTRSAFKYLLAGLLLSLLVLNSGALPTRPAGHQSASLSDSGSNDLNVRASPSAKRAPARAPRTKGPAAKVAGGKRTPVLKPGGTKKSPASATGRKPPAKAAVGKKGAKTCPAKIPAGKKTKRSLYRRDMTTHPSGRSGAYLFHGVSTLAVANVQKTGIDLKQTDAEGEYHARGGLCDGGFYLTDSLFAAAQFICHQGASTATTAYVNEYKWSPPSGLKHKAYSDINESGMDLISGAKNCQSYDILEGPMDGGPFGEKLHREFWQYAIVNQKTVAGLAYVNQYTIPCANVAAGKNLDSAYYQSGQKTNANFAAFANQLEGKC